MTEHQTKNIRQHLISALKWVWMIAVLIGFVVYINQNFDNIIAQLRLVSVNTLVLTTLFLILARLSITLMTLEVLKSLGHSVNFSQLFYIVSTSELAKYLPGGIWHFVGRASFYKSIGIPTVDISLALIKENLWLIVSAFMASACLLVLGYTGLQYLWVLILFSLIWIAIIYLWGRNLSLYRIIAIVLLQFAIWILSGLSFSILLSLSNASNIIIITIGAFTLSWLIGFLALFAPGGIGVREIILVTLLSPLFIDIDISVLALTHRIIWIAVELILGLIAWIFFNINRREH